ncbi:hypothetical protein ABZ806_37230 [Spirillospora sp. NPDC047418]
MTGIAVLGTLVAGCGFGDAGGDEGKDPAAPSAQPTAASVTEARARTIFAHYQKVNNKANAQVSDELLRSIESGPMLEADLAGNKSIRGKYEKKIAAFTLRDPQFFIPHTTGPAWFAVTAVDPKDGGTELSVFVDTGGGVYKTASAAWLAKGKKFPAIARNADGSATAVTEGAALGVGGKLSQYLTAAVHGEQPTGFVPGPLTSTLGKKWAKSVRKINGGYSWVGGTSWKARPQPVYALKTADGGALVMSVSSQSLTYTALHEKAWYQPGSSFFGLGPKRYHKRFSGELLWMFATHVPASGPADVLAKYCLAVSASGS